MSNIENTNTETIHNKLQKSESFKYTHTRVIKTNIKTLRRKKIISTCHNNIYEYYRILRTQILKQTQNKGWNNILITSVTPNEGKTTTAINLAISFAKEITKTVLLVDADLRNPSISKFFELGSIPGLSDYLEDQSISLPSLLVNPGIKKLVLLPGGNSVSNATEILESPRMESLVKEVKNRYKDRYIFFDSPSILTYADTLVLSSYVDAVILVIKAHKTTSEQLRKAIDLLDDKPILGIVINMMPFNKRELLHHIL